MIGFAALSLMPRQLIDQDCLDPIARVEPRGDSLILADRPVKSGGYAAAYSSWRRIQTSSEPPSLRPSGARSSSG